MTGCPIPPGVTLEALAAEVLALLTATLTNPADRPIDDWQGGAFMQSGHVFPFMDQNQYHRVGAWVIDNPRNNPLVDGGITQFTVQSVSDTVNGFHISPLAPGTAVVAGANVAETLHTLNSPLNKTVAIRCDDGTTHEARVTSVGPTSMSFDPPMPEGKIATAAGAGLVAWSRSARVIGGAAAGDCIIAVVSTMAADAGDYIRISLADGTVHLSTITAAVNATPSAVVFADPLPAPALSGAFVRIGTEDVDPSYCISRASARAIPGDHGPLLVFIQGETGNDRKAATAQVAQLFTRAVQPNRDLPNYAFDLILAMADPENPGGARGVFTFRNGMRAVNRGYEPGYGALNVNGVAVKDGKLCTFRDQKQADVDFGSLGAHCFTTVDVPFPGVLVGDHIDITVNNIAPDLMVRGYAEADNKVRLLGRSLATGTESHPINVSIVASRYAAMTLLA